MKKRIALLAFFVFAVSVVSNAKPKPHKEIVVLSDKNHVLYFRVDRSFVGGAVEIYDENKNLLEGDTLPHTHTIIYFDEMPAGHYFVKVKKGNDETEIEYSSI